jgi:hypothetical protein
VGEDTERVRLVRGVRLRGGGETGTVVFVSSPVQQDFRNAGLSVQ